MSRAASAVATGPQPRARVLVVDDEPPARRRLRRLLAGRDDVELIGECSHGREAVVAIDDLQPDLVFLDIQMPDLDGLGVVEQVGPQRMPVVVFITAYDQFAVDAFELSALDYLLKPFTDERFARAVERSLERLRQKRSDELCERLTCLMASHQHRPGETRPGVGRSRGPRPEPDLENAGAAPLQRISVQKGQRTLFVPVADIDWIEAEGAYVRLHVGGGTHLARDSLKNLEQRLDPRDFLRVHRSAMVRIDRVESMAPLFHGEYELTLRSGARVKLSRTYRHQLERLRLG